MKFANPLDVERCWSGFFFEGVRRSGWSLRL